MVISELLKLNRENERISELCDRYATQFVKERGLYEELVEYVKSIKEEEGSPLDIVD